MEPRMKTPVEFPAELGYMMAGWMLILFVGMGALMFWGILKKGGRPPWHSLIPAYQWVQVTHVCGKPAWWGWIVGVGQLLPLLIFPIMFNSMSTWTTEGPPQELPAVFGWFMPLWAFGMAGFVFQILIALAIVRVFGKSDGWAVGLILLPVVFYPIIGYGSSQYVGPMAQSPYGPGQTPPAPGWPNSPPPPPPPPPLPPPPAAPPPPTG